MSADATLAVVRRYHRAWTSGRFDEAGSCLGADLETDVPLNTYATTDDFVRALSGFGRLVERVDLLAELAQDDEAVLLYDMAVGPIGTIRIAEHFTVGGGRITRIRHVHDTAALRAAGFGRADA